MEKKIYQKPKISSVRLNVEQTILFTCKGNNITPGPGAQGIDNCTTTVECQQVFAS
jgi:hypothetical protein